MPNHKKPTALHILHGNPSKIQDLGKYEPKPAPVTGDPVCPDWVLDDGRSLWDRLFSQLRKLGILTSIDIPSFEMLCYYYGKWRQYISIIESAGETEEYTNKGGYTNTQISLAVRSAERAKDTYLKLAAEFGLIPASRSRIEVRSVDDELDEMEQLLSK